MTAHSDTVHGRRIARGIFDYSPTHREVVLSGQKPAVRAAAEKHLAVLDHVAGRDTAHGQVSA